MNRQRTGSKRESYTQYNAYAPASSRRIRSEKKKAITQSVVYIVAALLILLIFIFVVIPGFFGLITKFLDSSNPFQEVDKIAPQIPILSAPISATNSAQIKISGYGEPESEVIFVLNGVKMTAEKIKDDGSFEVPITLDEGENKITAYSVDAAKNESVLTKEYISILDTKAPQIESLEPKDKSSFESRANQSVTITGEINEDTEAKIYINGRVVFPKADGKFSYIFRLNEGENKIEVIAQDKAGNESKQELLYTFKL